MDVKLIHVKHCEIYGRTYASEFETQFKEKWDLKFILESYN